MSAQGAIGRHGSNTNRITLDAHPLANFVRKEQRTNTKVESINTSHRQMNEKKPPLTIKEIQLKNRIIEVMKHQGFKVNPHLRLPAEDKQTYKKIQNSAKMEQIPEHRKFLLEFFDRVKKSHLDGKDVVPENIRLELREVQANSYEARLFRWWNLVWWSMPYQRAYGRQMRFVLWDKGHDAPFGLIQLQSPLLRMKPRDDYLNIPLESLDYWANMSMNAQRSGALPPYNDLIGGKMTALALTSNEVRDAYRRKYEGRKTVMKGRVLEPNLLFITTTSAFGKSSTYDRLKYRRELAAVPIGYTKGVGTFHIPENLTQEIYSMLRENGVNTSTGYGHGPSRKIRLFKDAFARLELDKFYMHGIKREVYFFPLVRNIKGVIHDGAQPSWLDRPLNDLAEFWKGRWAIDRAERTRQWHAFDSDKFFQKAKQMINTSREADP